MIQERLIDEVKKRKWMYDKKHKDYPKRKEWFDMLANLFNKDYANFGLKCSGTQLMSAWDKLYSDFRKKHQILSNAPSGSSSDILKISNDPLYQSLLFVEDSVKPRPPLSSLDNVDESTLAASTQENTFAEHIKSNVNVWQIKSSRKKKSYGTNIDEPVKFKKQKHEGNEISETKELIGTMKTFIEKATNDISQAVKQDNNSNGPFDDKKIAIQNMLTKKFIKLSITQIEPAFKEMRKGIITILGESNSA